MPLTELQPNQIAQVVQLNGGRRFQARLASMGLLAGSQIEVIQTSLYGAILIAVGTTRLGIGQNMAKRIMIKTLKS